MNCQVTTKNSIFAMSAVKPSSRSPDYGCILNRITASNHTLVNTVTRASLLRVTRRDTRKSIRAISILFVISVALPSRPRTD